MTASNVLRTRLIQGGLASFALKAIHTVLNLAVSIVLARALAPEGYGIYAFAFSVMSLLALPVHLGMPVLVMRQVAQYEYHEQWGALRGLLRRTNQVAILLALLIGAIAALCGAYFSAYVEPAQYATFGWALLLLPLLALSKLRSSALKGLRQVVLGQLPELLLLPAALLLFLGLAANIGTLDPARAMAMYCGAALFAFVIGALLLRRAMPKLARAAVPEYQTSRWLHSVLPLSLLAGLQVINGQTDLFMLGLIATKEEVALYRVAFSAAALIIFLQTAADVVMAPYIARLHAAGDTRQLQRMVTQVARLVLVFGLPMAVVFVLWGKVLLEWVYGAEYGAAHTALIILCVGQLFNVAAGSVHLLLNMTNLEHETVRGVAYAAAINVVLNLTLIPIWGLEGAAFATTMSLVAMNLLLHRALWNKIGIWGSALMFERIRASAGK